MGAGTSELAPTRALSAPWWRRGGLPPEAATAVGDDVGATGSIGNADEVNMNPPLGSRAKTTWPELLGVDVDIASATVNAERPDMLLVSPTPEGSIVATDSVAARRVRLWYKPTDRIVSRVPVIG